MIGALVLQIFLIFLNAVFASAEIAVIQTNESKLQKKSEKGDKRAKRLLKLTSEPAKFLSTIQVAITLAGFLGSAFAADNFAGPLVELLLSLGVNLERGILNSICVVLITIILSFFSIIFGELLPKRLAMQNPEKKALGISGFLTFISIIFAPIVWILTASTNGLLRLLGINPKQEEEPVTEEEIILMAETGSEQGLIESEENQLIKNIFDFKDQTIGECCTHRKDTELLFIEESDEEWDNKIKDTHHTYYPVCGKNVDDVIGVLNTKNYFRLNDKSRKNVLKKAVDAPVFLNENLPCNEVFYKMKSKREYFGIVVDEYGGMCGIISLRDIISLIVGDFIEKDEVAEYTIKNIGENLWEINGIAPFDKVTQELNLNIDLEENDDFETFGGYVIFLKGDIPNDGDEFKLETENFDCTVQVVEKRCITKMQILVKPKQITEE